MYDTSPTVKKLNNFLNHYWFTTHSVLKNEFNRNNPQGHKIAFNGYLYVLI